MGSLGQLRVRDRAVRIGLIGCGYIAEQVHLPVWKGVAEAKIVCCVDNVEERANSLAKEFGIKSVYTNIEAMLDSQQVDLVDICTPPHTHTKVLEKLLGRGINCIVEKPLTLKYDEAKSLVSLAESTGARLYVVHNYSFVPAVRYIKHLISQGKLGEIKMVDTRYLAPLEKERYFSPDHWIHALPGGVLSSEIAPHLFMLVIEQIGVPVNVNFSFSKVTDLSYIPYDEMYCSLVSERGQVAHVALSFNSTIPLHTFDIIGTKGIVTADLFTQAVVYHPFPQFMATDLITRDKWTRGNWALSDIYQRAKSLIRVSFGVASGRYQMMMEGHRYLFNQCIANLLFDREYPVRISDALQVVKIIEMMGKSASVSDSIYPTY
jgi:predicted dehydrogenase